MATRTKCSCKMMERVIDFALDHMDAFPIDTMAGRLIEDMTAATRDFTTHLFAEIYGRKCMNAASLERGAARKDLRGQLRAIRRVGFAIPKSDNDWSLMMIGRCFAEKLEPFRKDLTSAVQRLDLAIEDQSYTEGCLTAARAGLAASSATVLSILKRLDRILEYTLRDNPPLWALWRRARG